MNRRDGDEEECDGGGAAAANPKPGANIHVHFLERLFAVVTELNHLFMLCCYLSGSRSHYYQHC